MADVPMDEMDEKLDAALRRAGELARRDGQTYYLWQQGGEYVVATHKPPPPLMYVECDPRKLRGGPSRFTKSTRGASQAERLIPVAGPAHHLKSLPGGTGEESAMDQERTAEGRTPRVPRPVTLDTIATIGAADDPGEPPPPPVTDAEAGREAVRARLDRRKRHNLLVRRLAGRIVDGGSRLYEDPFDLLVVLGRVAILAEIKTLDGTETDEVERTREALAQLLYDETFDAPSIAGTAAIRKVACFERRVTSLHVDWLNANGIAAVWQENDRFGGDKLAEEFIGTFLADLHSH